MKSTSINSKNILRVFIVLLFLSPAFLLTNCNKGMVKIYNIIDTVENCSTPYIVNFFPDAEYGNGDVSYEWDFGDGSSSTERNPVHVYENTGLFQVTLTITNKDAKESKTVALDLQEESISIIPYFEMHSAGSHAWAPVEMFFDNYSEHATSYIWDFGDEFSATNENPTHIYTQEGDYTVSLGAICNGDTAFQNRDLTVLPPPNDIYIDQVTVWLPDGFIGTDLYCVVFYSNFTVEESDVYNVVDFPVVFPIREEIFHFHGDYDDDVLAFEIWEIGNDSEPVYVFTIPMYRIQDNYYPSLLGWENGDFAAEVTVDYASEKK